MTEQWIVIPHWHSEDGHDGFQHYRDRAPTWIKFYTRLLHDDDYLSLTGDQRAILHGLWLEYASSDGQLRLDTRSITSRLRLRVTTRQLERLNQAGFIHFYASKPLALRYQHASPETDTEKEVTTQTQPTTGRQPQAAIHTHPRFERFEHWANNLNDRDAGTAMVLAHIGRTLPDSAFATALESLKARRNKPGAPLNSETRYYIATLKRLADTATPPASLQA